MKPARVSRAAALFAPLALRMRSRAAYVHKVWSAHRGDGQDAAYLEAAAAKRERRARRRALLAGHRP